MTRKKTTLIGCAFAALILGAFTGSVVAAPFTPGNLVVCTVPPQACSASGSAQQITLREYTTAGVLVQTLPLPTSGANFGLANGAGTANPQIHFSDANNQQVYIATSFTNINPGTSCTTNSESPGYILYNAATNTVIDAVSDLPTPTAAFDARGVDTLHGCTVFNTTSGNNNGTYKTLNDIAIQFMFGNARYLQIMEPYPGFPNPPQANATGGSGGTPPTPTGSALGYVTSAGTSGGFTGNGLYTFDPLVNSYASGTAHYKLFNTTGNQPLGFVIADANTIYLTETYVPAAPNAASCGIYKFVNTGVPPNPWVNLGRRKALSTETVSATATDVAAVISGGNATLYLTGGGQNIGGTKVYKIGPDPMNDQTASHWQDTSGAGTTPTVTLVSGLSGAKSIAIVPPVIVPPTYTATTPVSPPGSGSVAQVSDPPGTPSPYPQCTIVDLTATANAGFAFLQWTGGASGSDNPVQIDMDSNKTVTANFTDTATHFVLTINFSGRGTVSANPPSSVVTYTNPPIGVQKIAYTKPGSTTVTLTATPVAVPNGAPSATFFVFDHWTGPVANPTASTTTVTVDADKTVTAVFLPIYRVRLFATGNGAVTINSPAQNDGMDPTPPNPLNGYYRLGTVLNLQATAGTFNTPPPVQPWNFTEWQDVNAAQLSLLNPYTTAAVVAPADYTALFTETPASGSPQNFTPGNVVVGQVRDFSSTAFPGEIDIREYTPSGQLAQPVIRIPTCDPIANPGCVGSPSGQANSPTSGVGMQMAFDKINARWLYTSVNKVNGGLNTGFIRTEFANPAFAFNLSTGTFDFGNEGRGVLGQGRHVYYGFDGGLRDYDRLALPTPTDSLVAGAPPLTTDPCFSDNVRMLRVFNNTIYLSTAGSSDDFDGVAPHSIPGGPGIYSVTPTGAGTCSTSVNFTTATLTKVLDTPGATPLDFVFADATHLYVGFNSTNAGAQTNLHKFVFTGGQWVDQSALSGGPGVAALFSQWATGMDLTVAPNNNDVTLYFMTSDGPTNGYLYRIDDKLDGTLDTSWFNFDEGFHMTKIVPQITRGRAVQIVRTPACATVLGDLNGDGLINGKDICCFVKCLVPSYAGTCTPVCGTCGCADINSDGIVDLNDMDDPARTPHPNGFIKLLLGL